MTIPRLLVVDDDEDMREMLVAFLRRSGFICLPAGCADEIHAALEGSRIDLILLDVMLGDENGIEICAGLRASHDVPVVIVSALSADHQRMAGYDVGADDYVAKPFNPDLLLARVKAVLRRGRRTPSLDYRRANGAWRFSGWRFDGRQDEVVSPEGVHLALSRREAGLLKVLLANPHVPLTREEIAAALDVTGDGEVERAAQGRAIDVLVGRLRSKIEADPRHPQLLRTARGVGYVLGVDVEAVGP